MSKIQQQGKVSGLAGKPFVLKDAIAYQPGAVVSREIVRNGAGTLTVFAFDKGQGLSEHTAPFDATVGIVDGEAVITIDGAVSVVKKGGMVVMPANKPHALMARRRFKMLLIMIRG